MTLLEAYLENYQRIASDHVQAWRETGLNPFQDPVALRANEDATFGNVTRYVTEGSFILDAGCGMGDLMLRLRKNYDVQGAEIAEPYLEVLHERHLEWIKSPIEDLPFADDLFDAVVAADVLEHVIDLHAAVKELLRVLRSGGHIIVRAPNSERITWPPLENYPFIHLRSLDEGTLGILFERIFGCSIMEMTSTEQVIHLVARK